MHIEVDVIDVGRLAPAKFHTLKQWVVITTEPAAGKTSLLKMMAFGLYDSVTQPSKALDGCVTEVSWTPESLMAQRYNVSRGRSSARYYGLTDGDVRIGIGSYRALDRGSALLSNLPFRLGVSHLVDEGTRAADDYASLMFRALWLQRFSELETGVKSDVLSLMFEMVFGLADIGWDLGGLDVNSQGITLGGISKRSHSTSESSILMILGMLAFTAIDKKACDVSGVVLIDDAFKDFTPTQSMALVSCLGKMFPGLTFIATAIRDTDLQAALGESGVCDLVYLESL